MPFIIASSGVRTGSGPQPSGGGSLRFDDMLATLLAQPAPTPEARAILWRQVVDVLAQGRGHSVDDPLVDAPRAMDAYNFLRSVRAEIPAELRLAAGRGVAGR